MTVPAAERPAPSEPGRARLATERHYLMCRPDFFEVRYAINPWMDPSVPVDRERALAQWSALRSEYEALGHRVSEIGGVAGLPDMVFAANAAIVSGGRAVAARFRFAERAPESSAYVRALRELGVEEVVPSDFVNEGEGDFLHAGSRILAGHGFRSELGSHTQVERALGIPVVSLRLVDPRFYHLDTALGVLDEETIAYLPEAFSPGSRQVLAALYPDAILAEPADAAVLGLNFVSDGRNVVLPAAASGLAAALRERGFDPVGVEVSELLKAGGGPKCCTLELRGLRS